MLRRSKRKLQIGQLCQEDMNYSAEKFRKSNNLMNPGSYYFTFRQYSSTRIPVGKVPFKVRVSFRSVYK